MHIVIIGAGAAGISAVETIRKYDESLEITVINKENTLPYSLVALHEYIIGNISKEKLYLWDKKFIKKKNINLILGKVVVNVLPNAKKIVLDDNSTIKYDKLLIATGAVPKLTKELKDKKGVFTLRTLEDAEAIKNHIFKRVIIYGAGAVALKIAVALHKIGIKVIILCRSRVCRKLFDEDISKLLHKKLTENGIKIVNISKEIKFIGNPIEGVKIGKKKFKCDGVIAGIGIVPNTSFLNSKEILLGKSNGIIVNKRLETSVRDIYAAGDCSETFDIVDGKKKIIALWPPAIEQGKISALNMLGKNVIYEGTLSQTIIDVFDKTFVSIGSIDGEKITKRRHGVIERFTIKNGKVVGVQIFGSTENWGVISLCIKKGIEVKDLRHLKTFKNFNPRIKVNFANIFRKENYIF